MSNYKNSAWTSEEDRALEVFWSEGYLAPILAKRSPRAMRMRASRIGLTHRIKWTEEEEIWLIECIDDFFKRYPDRTFTAVAQKLIELQRRIEK